VVTWNLFVALALLVAVAATAVSARIDLRLAFTLAAYPSLFALIFALASAPDPLTGATIVIKAVAAGLCAVTVVLTTPYPHIFAPVQRVVPGIVGDALLMTYRSVFILAEKFGDLLRAVRLRAGISARQPVRAARATTRALGGLLLYSFDLSQREYDILRLRGYEGGLRVSTRASSDRAADAAALAYAVLVLVVVIAFRARPSLAGYAWLVTVAGVIDLMTGLVIGRRSR